MDTQEGSFGAQGAHGITIEGVDTAEVMHNQECIFSVEGAHGKTIRSVDTAEVMNNQEDTSGAKGVHSITIAAEAMDNQEGTSGAERAHGIIIREPSLLKKMHQKLTSKLQMVDDSEEVTIFRAPLKIWESNKSMFEPIAVSIGPYYRGRTHLKAMEEKKWSFLQDFLFFKGCTLQHCISEIKKLEKRARCCYNEPFDMSSDDFVEMMILDGCFIIKHIMNQIVEGWTSHFIKTDLLLLENQIPFFIIEELLGYSLNSQDLVKIIGILTWRTIPINAPSHPQKIHHLLHLFHCCTVPTRSTENIAFESIGSLEIAASEWIGSLESAASEPNRCPFLNWIRTVPVFKYFCLEKEEKQWERMVWHIPNATELEEAGVKFKKLEQSRDITKITFQSGTLLIPRLRINDRVKPYFMNLVAFEQCMLIKVPCHFSTYMMFMDKLVNTAQDVKILQNNGIFESLLSSEKEVALFFNQSGVNVLINQDHYLAELFVKVNKYCDSRYHRYRARLSRDYFNNPWSIISLIAAVVLLLLTFAQTFMAVYSYIRPPS